jgi:hypothetical protein
VIEIQPVLMINIAATAEMKKVYAGIYWWNEQIIQVLMFLIVISLAYGAMAQVRPRRILLAAAIAGTLVFAGVTFALTFDSHVNTGAWMTKWLVYLDFGAAILDLGLWAVLLSSRERDHRILMVAAGLGIQFTGGAIGQAGRDLSRTLWVVMGDLTYLTNLICLYIWWQAFRQPRRESRPGPPPPPLPPSTPAQETYFSRAAHK